MATSFRICFLLTLLAAAAALSSSCTKSEFIGPTLASDSANYKRTFTINPGDSVTLASKFERPETLSYEWTLNGQVLATEGESFRFTSTEPGSYIITQKIYNSVAQVYLDYYVTVRGAYDNGSFIFTNNANGALVNYVSLDYKTVNNSLYQTVNPGKTLGTKITGVNSFYGKMYVLSESEGIVVLNSITLKEEGRLPKLPAKPNFIINVSRATALLSTDDGIYKVQLNPLVLGEKIPNLSGRVGMMVNSQNYTLALTLSNGIVAINTNNFLVAKILNVGKSGLTADRSGNAWTSYVDTLYRISPTLMVTKYLFSKTSTGGHIWVTSSWNPWNEGTLTYSPLQNLLFFVVANPDGSPSNEIVKVDISSMSSFITATSYIKLPNNRSFTGIGFRINSDNNIIASTVDSNGGDPQMMVYRAGDGSLVTSVPISAINAKAIISNRVK